mgnify:CR=1 FL=1
MRCSGCGSPRTSILRLGLSIVYFIGNLRIGGLDLSLYNFSVYWGRGTLSLFDLPCDDGEPWKDQKPVKNADACDAPVTASVAVANPIDAPTTRIEEAVAELASLVLNIERRLARSPIPEQTSPLTPHLRRSPAMRRRFD